MTRNDWVRGQVWKLRNGQSATILEPLAGGAIKVLMSNGKLAIVYPGEIDLDVAPQIS